MNNYDGAPRGGSAREAKKGASCEFRSLRGGGWSGEPQVLRSADRFGFQPDVEGHDVGFRLGQDMPTSLRIHESRAVAKR